MRAEEKSAEFAYLLSASVDPRLGVAVFDTATDLQAAWPRCQGFLGRLVISRAEHDHMATTQVILPVQIGVVCSAIFRREVGLQVRGSGRESAANDLLDRASVQVDTRPKFCHLPGDVNDVF